MLTPHARGCSGSASWVPSLQVAPAPPIQPNSLAHSVTPFTQLYFFPVSPLRTRDVLNLKPASCGVFTPPWVAGLRLQRVGGEGVWEEKAPSSFQVTPEPRTQQLLRAQPLSWEPLLGRGDCVEVSGAEQGRSLLSP